MIICCRRGEEMLIKIDGPSLNEVEIQNDVIDNLRKKIDKKKNDLDSLNKQIMEYNRLQEELESLDKEIEEAKEILNELINKAM